MTWKLRPYQREAIDAIYQYWEDEGGNPLIVLPDGTGKSGVAGTITRELCDNFADMRIVNVTHVAELVEQNYKELVGMWEWAPAGVYSAGLNRRELGSQILFAGIQSVHKRVIELGSVDLLMVDEAHLIPRSADTMYGHFIAGLREANPDMRLLGLTATPIIARTPAGSTKPSSAATARGPRRCLTRSLMSMESGRRSTTAILKPLMSKATASAIDTTGVGQPAAAISSQGALQAAADKDELNRAIVEEALAYGSENRRSWLVFATGKEHAAHLRDELKRRGVSAECITDDTTTADRRRFVAAFKAYQIRALVNCGVLTTGFNHPGVDMIVAARPTESAGLYVQIAGRGTRPVYAPGVSLETREGRIAAIANGPCPNCLFLDFGGLVRRHGPIDMVSRGSRARAAATLRRRLVRSASRSCTPPLCNVRIAASNFSASYPTSSRGRRPSARSFRRATPFGSRFSNAASIVTKNSDRRRACALSIIAAAAAISPPRPPFSRNGSPSKAKRRSARPRSWWRQNGGLEPVPATTSEALSRAGELSPVNEIRIEPDGQVLADYRPAHRRRGDRQ
jgi:DNA repair protein RadD